MDRRQHPDLRAIAKAIIDTNLYMTLATADEDDRPSGDEAEAMSTATSTHVTLGQVSRATVAGVRTFTKEPW